MEIEHDISGCLQRRAGPVGLTDEAYKAWCEKAGDIGLSMRQQFDEGRLPILSIAEARDDLALAREAYLELSAGAHSVVFLGTGGSSLGGQTIAQLGGWSIPGDDGKSGAKMPRTRIMDNLDPRSLSKFLSMIDLATTRFVVISKSGNTAETLLQAICVIQAFQAAGKSEFISASILGLSEPRRDGVKNGLRDLLEPKGCKFLEHETDIGGRFSALTNVGLLLAIARGLDAGAIRSGAMEAVTSLLASPDFDDCMPVQGAAVNVGLLKESGISNVVMMPYANQLDRFSRWFVQLWAESLGKEGLGTTPIAALGPVDQHSQLQLYMDGPKDKLITVIASKTEGQGTKIAPELAGVAGIDYMADQHIGDLVAAQAEATTRALTEAGRPTRFIRLSEIDEPTLGFLLMSFMIETVLTAGLLGVDPFDQPAVEVGKRLARDFLSD